MSFLIHISDGIMWLLVGHGIRYDIAQELAPVFTPIPPSSPEGLVNEVHAPHDAGDNNY